MSFFRSAFSAIANSFNYTGRANRREFWYWIAFVAIIYLALRYFELKVLTPWAGFLPFEEVPLLPYWALDRYPDLYDAPAWLPNYLSWISFGWLLLSLIPLAALIVRRVHDHDRSGWMALTVVPLVWWLTAKGTKGSNRYG